MKDGCQLRYKEQLIEQALIQKLARYISDLHATTLLLSYGFIQQQATLQRVMDEIQEDVVFLALAITNDKVTDLHSRYLQAFYSEDYTDESNPVGTLANREMVPRKKIRAYISRLTGGDTSTHNAVSKTVSKVYSGFVHAASPHIMDMCIGDPPRFHLRGMRNTTLMEDYEYDIWNYFYRGLVSATIAGKAFGDGQLVNALLKYSYQFQEAAGRDFGARKPATS